MKTLAQDRGLLYTAFVKLSIVIPCYNEERTIATIIERVLAVDLGPTTKEVLVVDDGSTDRSAALAEALAIRYPGVLRVLRQPTNMGKGAALQRGFQEAAGDLVAIQDADLEYDPQDFQQMLALFRLPGVSVVFGSRRLIHNPVSNALYYSVVPFVTIVTYLLYQRRISDQFTCYKMIRRDLLRRIPLRARGFVVDGELLAKLFRLGVDIHEVPITYRPRGREEGKKVRLRDGFHWMWELVRQRFSDPARW